MKPKRNEPCPCGSGQKYKVCCASKRTSRRWLALGAVVLFAVGAVWVLGGMVRRIGSGEVAEAPPGKVWNEEHGHWHDAPTANGERPPGPTPPGKVWNEEHGHWHDAPAGLAPSTAEAPATIPDEAVSYVDEP